MRIVLPSLVAVATLLAAMPMPVVHADDGVKVFRCVDAKGHVTLGDSPCPQGTSEQVRTMQRPVDGTPRVIATPARTPETAGPAAPQVVVMRTPQPMYECVAPNGDRYTSDTGDGNPRWVPTWIPSYGYPRPYASIAVGDRTSGGGRLQPPPLGGNVGAPPPPRPPIEPIRGGHRPHPPHRPPPYGGIAAGGSWVRDTCHALPPAEVCARVRDRREEIRRRFFNAQETERNELRREERSLNARLSADCGIG